jgi:hypothetical protein
MFGYAYTLHDNTLKLIGKSQKKSKDAADGLYWQFPGVQAEP